ncbi:MAG: hypothetical protein HYW27_01695 [Candidatus Aenigmarchaeota archaeon]|nr:hypothetical protein [Candidatus Aenigmarchaeota archaeon]
MSWNTRVIENSIKAINHGHDVALGSRAAAGSSVKRALNRRIFSFTYNIMLRILFGLDIGDTQGTVAIKKSDLGKYEDNLLFDDPFLQTEILIHSRKLGLNIVEIPVNVTDTRKESKIRPVRTGLKMSSSMLKKFMSLYF